ncbi:hypothetical protein OEZ85_011743 [Tetradesmus obliquus]|uniref:Intimal thickness related receptor IRP domain-containing protein n=1 Tax=Tetradesmus obliquus TaxID=3088 RepID=A0ABY8TRC6_TETOB|nr:hypothetical protein OEZ85_011743 [Tetradesmus obliquus]
MSRSYFISKESLYIHPACLCVAEHATLTVHSLKLQLCPATAQALVVLALDSSVVFEAAINSTRDPLKIAIPPQVLGSTGVLTVYVVLCDAAGRISDIVDSGKLAVVGYEDPCLERSYLVFKNHSSALLDTTALLICGGMLAAAAMRSVDFKADPEALGKLGVVLLYGLLFFMPYAVMQLRRQLFLRYREVLLVLARTLTASVLILVAVKAVPQPGAWVSVVGNTLAMQLQNGVILPSCQQVRLPAAAAIAAAHLPSDALLLALPMPVRSAVLTSVLMQLCMLLVTVAQDAWCRHRFTQRYLGVAADVGPARAAARQAPAAAAVDEQAQTVRPAVYAGGGEAGCSNADAVLRQRRPVQQAQ